MGTFRVTLVLVLCLLGPWVSAATERLDPPGKSSGKIALELVAAGSAPTTYNPGRLESETTYFWRVDSRDACGVRQGPVWSFSTGTAVDPVVPGDCQGDGLLDFSDGICLLGFVFLGNPPALPCAGGEPDDRGNVQLLDWLGDPATGLARR